MKKMFFQKPLLAAFLCIIFFSCEIEEISSLDSAQESESNNSSLVEQVDFNSVPEISQALEGISGKPLIARSYSDKGDSNFWIDERDVLKLRDSVSNESYSIVIHTDEPSPTVFYNLVVTKRTDGNPIVPFVVEYKFENGSDVQSFAQDKEKNFDGKVNIYSLHEFANITGLNSKDTEPVICFQDVGVRDNVVAGSEGSSSSGGGTSGGSSTTGSASSSPTVSVTRTHISVSSSYGSTGTVIVGEGTFYMPPMTSDKQDQKAGITSKEEDENVCPEGWVSIPINEVIDDDLVDPSCESFAFYKVGTTGVQVAAVNGIWDIVTKWDKCPGIGAAVSYQTYYFHLPARLNPAYAAEMSADALAGAFYDLQKWFQKQSCGQINTGVLAYKMDEFIKENFKEIGGQATRNAPLGWMGTARQYKEDWMGTDDCY